MSYVFDLVASINSGGIILAALLGIVMGDCVAQIWSTLTKR